MPVPGAQYRFIKGLIYRLKQSFGTQTDIYYNVSEDTDYNTGRTTVTKQHIRIRRGILLPTNLKRDQLFNGAGADAATTFNYGGVTAVDTRDLVIDGKDLKIDLDIENTYVVVGGNRYQLVSIEEYPNRYAIYLKIKLLSGTQRFAQIDLTIQDELVVTEDPGGNDES